MTIPAIGAAACRGCGTRLSASMLACPACRVLVHGDALASLSAQAAQAAQQGDVSGELSAWRQVVELLPPASTQFATVRARIEQLSQTVVAPEPSKRAATGGRLGLLAAVALLVWKFKALAVFLLTKGKLLALGLTKSSTVFSMLASLGVYWAAYGWPFAAGLIASIYVHEMGHVAALRRFGIAATAPMFIPGIGAVIRSRRLLSNPHEEARVGLGGPIWGLAAALGAYGLHAVTSAPIWAAIGHFGAWVNLFNLMPVWQLDGAHAYRPMTRAQRWGATAAIVAAFVASGEGLLVLLAILSALQAWHAPDEAPGDRPVTAQYIGLVAVLAWMCTWSAPPQL